MLACIYSVNFEDYSFRFQFLLSCAQFSYNRLVYQDSRGCHGCWLSGLVEARSTISYLVGKRGDVLFHSIIVKIQT